jgi:hypothetical protein
LRSLLETLAASRGCRLLTTLLYLALGFAKRRNRRARTRPAIWRVGRYGAVDAHLLLLGSGQPNEWNCLQFSPARADWQTIVELPDVEHPSGPSAQSRIASKD